ncbi:hypothetical protein AU15_16385 [Marinobacter salarius]|uniref:Uncharacterized protein n=1 Tax=Marinobacter salarius TaxID=1420917 RepID=W5YWP7_9GAMM|nr:hypothetical protein AU15_16385 [Marinobacter salarius]
MKKVEGIFNEQRQATEFEMLAPGRFQSLSSGERVTYTEALSEDKRRLEGVFIAEHSEDGKGLTIITAREGSQFIDEQTGSRFLVLEDGARFEGLPGQLAYDVTGFEATGSRSAVAVRVRKSWRKGLRPPP